VGSVEIGGGGGDDLITGGAFADTLRGDAGNDTLSGGGGNDLLSGGAGDDLYIVDNTGVVLVEQAGQGVDTVRSSLTYTLKTDFENLTLTGASAINGTGNATANLLIGNAAANVLTGLDGDDTLDGGSGADTLVGGVGDDLYIVDDSGDQVIELVSQGTDTVIASVSYSLGDGVENLILSGTAAINGIGNAGNNILIGNGSSNRLDGAAGNDTLIGGSGADQLIGGIGTDTADYSASTTGVAVNLATGVGAGGDAEGDALSGIEDLIGSAHNDRLTGDGADNVLIGGDGDDVLDGGGGNDTLSGGAGVDVVMYATNYADAILSASGSGWVIHGNAGTVFLDGIEEIRFLDRNLYLDGRNNTPILPDASDLFVVTDEDKTPLMVDLLAGVTDFDDDPLSVTALIQSAGPTAHWELVNGKLSIDPAQFNSLAVGQSQTFTFTYGITDGTATVARTLTLSVEGRNDAPVANADSFSGYAGIPVLIKRADLLSNDVDPDGDALILQSIGNAVNGSVHFDADGNILFTSGPEFRGRAQFDYTISDGRGGTAVAQANIDISRPPGPPSLIVAGQSVESGKSQLPAVAALANGDTIIAFVPRSDQYVYLRRYNAAGQLVAGDVQVNVDGGIKNNVATVGLAGGGYVVSWSNHYNGGSDWNVEVVQRRFDAAGKPVGSDMRVNTWGNWAGSTQGYPSLAALRDGGWITTWLSSGQDGSGWSVIQRRYDSNGQAVGGEVLVNTATSGDQVHGRTAGLADGGWVTSWWSNGQDGSGWGIYQQRF
ncbi:hypothetical protein FW320_34185, partial [Azospirillum sp. Vi22]|uniref:cadherin-like domain-containing protein n=1 Tax=Azospirillum baldaniorum TaxID=1064539 RepID=UPI00157B04AB